MGATTSPRPRPPRAVATSRGRARPSPFAVLGNTWLSRMFHARPNWALPDLWMWQLLWWALGVAMMWLLAFKLQMSTHVDEARMADA